jgi:hypothetical protein
MVESLVGYRKSGWSWSVTGPIRSEEPASSPWSHPGPDRQRADQDRVLITELTAGYIGRPGEVSQKTLSRRYVPEPLVWPLGGTY